MWYSLWKIGNSFVFLIHLPTSRFLLSYLVATKREEIFVLNNSFLQKGDVFHVTVLIIPKQVGTSDTCATTDEEGIQQKKREINRERLLNASNIFFLKHISFHFISF